MQYDFESPFLDAEAPAPAPRPRPPLPTPAFVTPFGRLREHGAPGPYPQGRASDTLGTLGTLGERGDLSGPSTLGERGHLSEPRAIGETPFLEGEAGVISQPIAEALGVSDWKQALKRAIAENWRDDNALTNMIFSARFPEAKDRRLDPKVPKDAALAKEWIKIRDTLVWPAIRDSAANRKLAVDGDVVAAHHRAFWGASGKRFKERIEWAAKQVDLDPGLLAVNLLAEERRDVYLRSGPVDSYTIGVDDFYELREHLAANVPGYAKVAWDKNQTPRVHYNDARKPRLVKTITFDSGKAGVLASAVYLKYGEVELRKAAAAKGKAFDKLSLETRFALIRMAFNHGLPGTTKRLYEVLGGTPILIRQNLPLKPNQPQRNATIHTARALHLDAWIFRKPDAAGTVEREANDHFRSDFEAATASSRLRASAIGTSYESAEGLEGSEFESGEGMQDSEFESGEPMEGSEFESVHDSVGSEFESGEGVEGSEFESGEGLEGSELESGEGMEGSELESGKGLEDSEFQSDEQAGDSEFESRGEGLEDSEFESGAALIGHEERTGERTEPRCHGECGHRLQANESRAWRQEADAEPTLPGLVHEVLPSRWRRSASVEEAETSGPRGLLLLDHSHAPKSPNPKTPGTFTVGARRTLRRDDMNPGYIDAADNLIVDSSSMGLQTCLQSMIAGDHQDLLARRGQTAPAAGDRVRVAVVDLTGKKLSSPDYAGWGSPVAIYGASVPKILALYGACQLRSDLRDLIKRSSPTDGAQLQKAAIAEWKAKGWTVLLPNLAWMFDIRKWKSGSTLDFTTNVRSSFAHIADNCPAGKLIANVSLPYIGSLAWQSGLYHPKRGGLWLKAAYCGMGSWASPVAAPYSANATALSAATYFTLLAQGRLVDDASSTQIKTALAAGCVTSLLPSLPVVASKCGIWSGYTHDCAWIEDSDVRYVIAVMSRLETRRHFSAYTQLCTDIDKVVRANNKSPKTTCR